MRKGIRINGNFLSHADLLNQDLAAGSAFEDDIIRFYREWFSNKDVFEVKTSGSTGVPKTIAFTRNQLIISAQQTIDTFNLQTDQNILLCLSPQFIAGKMMIVRALVGDLNLSAIEPAGNPLIRYDEKIHFMAVVPQQLLAMVENPETNPKTRETDTIIVGGGMVNEELLTHLSTFGNNIYQTFGMTETLTHVAIRKISNPRENHYSLLKGVDIDVDKRGCLMVKSPVNDRWIVTNDVAEIVGSRLFNWLGRYDNIINSGGIKISPEEIEKEIAVYFGARGVSNNFFVGGIADEKLGEKLVLFIEENNGIVDQKSMLEGIKAVLPKYKSPKDVFLARQFIYTSSGKIQRKETLNLILSHGK